MSDDQFTVTTSESWLSRMKGALSGVLIGVILVPASIWLLVWNEGRAVQTARSLDEGAAAVVSVKASPVDAGNDKKLVHVTGKLATNATLTDPEFGISRPGIRLVRKVEMYQWIEKSESRTREKVGGGKETVTTYTYRLSWSDKLVESGRFKRPAGHENPGQMKYSSRSWQAGTVTLGDFSLPRALINRVGQGEALIVNKEQLDAFKEKSSTENASIADGKVFIGENAGAPKVGDLRVSFELVPVQNVSIVAQQSGKTFGPYQTRAGDAIMMLTAGTVAANAMFKSAQSANRMLTWGIRLGGTFLMFIAFGLILRPITTLGAVLPILSQIVALGTGLIALALTVLIAPITMAIAWLAYRPVTGIIFIAVGVALFVGLVFLRRALRKGKAADPAAG